MRCALPMLPIVRGLLALVLLALSSPATAQDGGEATLDLFAPGMIAPRLDFGPATGADSLAAPVPYAPSLEGTLAVPLPVQQHDLVLEARLITDGPPVSEGVTWRVF